MEKITRHIFLGFVRIHLLHHAAEEPVFGLDMIQELGRHGYDMSPGTLYPILHGLEEAGYLKSENQNVHGKLRKYYCITDAGQALLREIQPKIRELVREVLPA